MSSMLEEAIIDAEALKEAAKKNAEEKIIEHYSKDIKEAVDLILEQDPMADPMMGGADPMMAGADPMMGAMPGMGTTMAPTTPFAPQAPGAAAPADPGLVDIEATGEEEHEGEMIVTQAPYAATTSDRDIVSIDLNKLEEAIQNVDLQEYEDEDDDLMEEYDIDDDLMEEYDVAYDRDDEDAFEDEDEDTDLAEGYPHSRDDEDEDEDLMEEYDIDEDDTDSETIEEMIRNILAEEASGLFEEKAPPKMVDPETACQKAARLKKGAEGKSWSSSSDEKDAKEAEKACAEEKASTQKESRVSQRTLKEHKQLNKKVKLLEHKLNKYQEVFPQLKQQLEESNLQNARLHYQNRILNSDSLNERQKDRLVETISKATTVEEAKIIYETLQSTVGISAPSRRPKSLNEVVTKRSSAFMPRKEEKRGDPLAARMKALAGIADK